MRRFIRILMGAVLVGFTPALPAAGITITNSSFEQPSTASGPSGTTTIPGWTAVGANVGTNPTTDATGATTRPFANNGAIPDGQKVAYLQSLSNPAVFTSLYQDLYGFEATKSYVLVYYENSRANYTNAMSWVTLGADKIVQDHVVTAVTFSGNYSVPYRRTFSKEFQVNAAPADPVRLTFSMKSSGGRGDIPPEVRDNVGADSALLIDHIFIHELGNTKLTAARRSFVDHQLITLKFGPNKLNPSTANALNNYVFNPPLGLESARLLADGQTVELRTGLPLTDSPEYTVTVRGILDDAGRAMFATNSVATVQVNPLDPAELTKTVSGFLDDFTGNVRNQGWEVRGADVYQQNYGVLKVSTAPGGPNHLVYVGQPYDLKNQEVLARIRVNEVSGAGSIGIAASTDAQSKGVNLLLQNDGSSGARGVLFNDADGGLKTTLQSWQSDTWYWLRLVHSAESGKAVVKAKIWKADRDTAEPASFETFEYGAASSMREGQAGLAATINDQPGSYDVDWILIKADGLPQIVVTEPAPPEVALTIRQVDGKIHVLWPKQASTFQLQRNETLSPETWADAGTPEDNGGEWQFIETGEGQLYFYRLVDFSAQIQ